MALIVKPNTFSAGATILSAEHNENFDTVYNLVNGNIDNNNIKSSAGIVDTKLAQISTAGKVSGAALTSLANVPSGAGGLPGANGGIPSGGIILWSGAISAIPSGFVICDGTNSTPDLTDRFVIHADADSGGTRDVGDTGGASTHTHTLTTSAPGSGSGTEGTGGVAGPNHTHTATTAAGSNIPKYYALAYIMKT